MKLYIHEKESVLIASFLSEPVFIVTPSYAFIFLPKVKVAIRIEV